MTLDHYPDDGPCVLCGAPRDMHVGRKHAFTLTGQLDEVPTKPPTPQKITYGGDIALRKLLVDKGLITGPELEQANAEVQAILGGDRGSDSRRRSG